MESVSIGEIEDAQSKIAGFVDIAPIVRMEPHGLRLKAESLHPVGSFKIRGAFNAILSLTAEQQKQGVVACSSGNHAQAVAYVCNVLRIAATIIMPETAPEVKVAAASRWGAEIVIHGRSSDDLTERAEELARRSGAVIVEPFDSKAVIAGAGTVGLEILAAVPEVKQIVVPASGGGLLSGIAAVVKQSKPHVKVIGVEPALAADVFQSFQAGHIVGLTPEEAGRTIADGLRVQRLSELTWHHVKTFVDDIRTVTEAEIVSAMRFLAANARLVAEPSGAVSVAAALREPDELQRSTVVVLSGGNVDLEFFARTIVASSAQ